MVFNLGSFDTFRGIAKASDKNIHNSRFYFLNMEALPLLNKNSSELSLPLFAIATFGALFKLVPFYKSRVYFKQSNCEIFFQSYQFCWMLFF